MNSSLCQVCVSSFLLMSCGQTIDESGLDEIAVAEINPLDTMAIGEVYRATASNLPVPSGFLVGDTIEVASPNTPLFSVYPKSGVVPDTLLPLGTILQILEVKGEYLQVSGNKGIIGYVPTIMVVPLGIVELIPLNRESAERENLNLSEHEASSELLENELAVEAKVTAQVAE